MCVPAVISILALSAGKVRRIHLVAITKNFPVTRRYYLLIYQIPQPATYKKRAPTSPAGPETVDDNKNLANYSQIRQSSARECAPITNCFRAVPAGKARRIKPAISTGNIPVKTDMKYG
jgi:hypothetical protein